MQEWGRYTEAIGARLSVWWVPGQLLTGAHLGSLSLGQLGEWWGICRALRSGYFPTDLEICQCFNNQYNCSGCVPPEHHWSWFINHRRANYMPPWSALEGAGCFSGPWFGYYGYTEIKEQQHLRVYWQEQEYPSLLCSLARPLWSIHLAHCEKTKRLWS